MIGIFISGHHIARVLRRRRELTLLGGGPGHAQIVEIASLAALPRAAPMLVDQTHIKGTAISAKGMEIGVAELCPIDKLNAQFERSLGCLDKIALINAQGLVEQLDRRDRRFTYADRADFLGFNQGNLAILFQRI